MGGIQSSKKYVLLYGPKGSGKSTLLYNQNSTIKLFEPIEPTKGVNYEELSINHNVLGVFEVSGDLKQSHLISIVSNSVNVSGIIYVVDIQDIENLDMAKAQLKLLLANPNLEEYTINLFVIYNIRNNDRERFSWMGLTSLDDGLGLKKIKEKYHLKSVSSTIYDCSINNNDVIEEKQLLSNKMKEFTDELFK